MKIVPVLDVLNGQVVRGMGGERHRYRPIASRLSQSSGVRDVALSLRETFSINELYVADLDAIEGRGNNNGTIATLVDEGFHIALDSGLRSLQDVLSVPKNPGITLILALETLPGFDLIEQALEWHGPQRTLFSLDLKAGQPLTCTPCLSGLGAEAIVQEVLNRKCQRILVLDLADVGMGQGTRTVPLCRYVRQSCIDAEIWTGGGVSGPEDLDRLGAEPIDRLLVASALHDGRIQSSHLDPRER